MIKETIQKFLVKGIPGQQSCRNRLAFGLSQCNAAACNNNSGPNAAARNNNYGPTAVSPNNDPGPIC